MASTGDASGSTSDQRYSVSQLLELRHLVASDDDGWRAAGGLPPVLMPTSDKTPAPRKAANAGAPPAPVEASATPATPAGGAAASTPTITLSPGGAAPAPAPRASAGLVSYAPLGAEAQDDSFMQDDDADDWWAAVAGPAAAETTPKDGATESRRTGRWRKSAGVVDGAAAPLQQPQQYPQPDAPQIEPALHGAVVPPSLGLVPPDAAELGLPAGVPAKQPPPLPPTVAAPLFQPQDALRSPVVPKHPPQLQPAALGYPGVPPAPPEGPPPPPPPPPPPRPVVDSPAPALAPAPTLAEPLASAPVAAPIAEAASETLLDSEEPAVLHDEAEKDPAQRKKKKRQKKKKGKQGEAAKEEEPRATANARPEAGKQSPFGRHTHATMFSGLASDSSSSEEEVLAATAPQPSAARRSPPTEAPPNAKRPPHGVSRGATADVAPPSSKRPPHAAAPAPAKSSMAAVVAGPTKAPGPPMAKSPPPAAAPTQPLAIAAAEVGASQEEGSAAGSRGQPLGGPKGSSPSTPTGAASSSRRAAPPPAAKPSSKAKAAPAVNAVNPLPQRGTNRSALAGGNSENAATSQKWLERPVEKLATSQVEEDIDPELACYVWDRKAQRPKAAVGRPAPAAAQAAPPATRAAAAAPPVQRQRFLLTKVVEMGFDEPTARQALASTGWAGVEEAVLAIIG